MPLADDHYNDEDVVNGSNNGDGEVVETEVEVEVKGNGTTSGNDVEAANDDVTKGTVKLANCEISFSTNVLGISHSLINHFCTSVSCRREA